MRRSLGVAVLFLALGFLAAILIVLLLPEPSPPPGAPRSQQLYGSLCASCHGSRGRGSWRATLLLMRPGDLADRSRMEPLTDRYLFDLIKRGGADIGKPGMPGFGFHLTDAEIEELVAYVRSLSAPSGSSRSSR